MRPFSFFACGVLAIALHAGALFGWRYQTCCPAILDVSGDAVEVSLVEASSREEGAAKRGQPESAALPPSGMKHSASADSKIELPEAEPAPSVAEREISKPLPPVAIAQEAPAPRVAPAPEGRKVQDIPRTASGEASKPAGGQKLPAPQKSALSGTGREGVEASQRGMAQNLLAPAYLSRPTVKYPPESRAAREEGVVILRITVNVSGRPISVEIARSSGFVRLDRAALEGGWRCRVGNAAEGAQFEAPMRFSLRD